MAKSKNTIESRIDYSILLPVLILLLVGLGFDIYRDKFLIYPKNLCASHVSASTMDFSRFSTCFLLSCYLNTEFL